MINDKMVLVEVRGVRFTAYIDQLDFPYFKRFTEKKNLPLKKEKTFVDQIPVDKSKKADSSLDGCWLRILPVSDTDEFGDEVVESLKIYLVNHTDKVCIFNTNSVMAAKRTLVFLMKYPHQKISISTIFLLKTSMMHRFLSSYSRCCSQKNQRPLILKHH